MARLTRNEKILCVIYAVIAIVAIFATWTNNLAFMQDPANNTINAWVDAAYANYAAASLTNDLLLLAVSVCIFIIIEGYRLKIRFAWTYVLLSGITAIAFTFPLFMIARQFAIAKQRASDEEDAKNAVIT